MARIVNVKCIHKADEGEVCVVALRRGYRVARKRGNTWEHVSPVFTKLEQAISAAAAC